MSTDTSSNHSTNRQTTITLIENPDGWWTAHDDTRGLTTQGETRADALASLDAVVAAVEDEDWRDPTDEELAEMGIDLDDYGTGGDLPEVLK